MVEDFRDDPMGHCVRVWCEPKHRGANAEVFPQSLPKMRRFIGTLQWARKCVTINDAPFDPDEFPWLKEIAETIDSVRGGAFMLKFPPQVFKSLFGQLHLARCVAVEPCPSLWYAVTGAEAGTFSDSKLSRLLETCPPIQRKRFIDPDNRGGKTIFKQPDMVFEMLGADNQNHRNSKSARNIYLDESWQYEPGALAEIFKRSLSYETSRRLIMMTTGPSAEDETDVEWEKSTKSEWRCVCPTCDALVPLVFGEAEDDHGIKWESNENTREPNGRWKVQSAAKTTEWVCPACKGRHRYSVQLQRRMNDPKRGAKYVQTNPTPSKNCFGWTAESVVFRNWESIVEEWLTACNAKKLGSMEGVEEFIRKNRVRSWDPSRFLKQNRTIPFGDYNMGDPWPDVGTDENGHEMVFMTCDVQKDHFWVVIRAWSNKPATWAQSRLVHFQKAHSVGELEDIRKRFKVQSHHVTMDCKWNDQAVYQWCHKYGYIAFAGIDVRSNSFLHSDGVRRIYDEPRMMDAFAGKAEAGHAFSVRIQFSSIAGKFRLEMTRQSRDTAGKPAWTVARDAPEEYLKQAFAEIMVRKRNPKGGWRTEFKDITNGENHAFDMESVQCVVASIKGILGAEALVEQEEDKE